MNELNTCINLNLYRVFYYVAKEKSISKAAKKLYISQPAISKSLKKLEEELNVELFVRNLSGVEITKAGLQLFEHVEKAANNLNGIIPMLKKYDTLDTSAKYYKI